MRLKKFLPVVLALILVPALLVSGCGAKSAKMEQPKSEAKAGGTPLGFNNQTETAQAPSTEQKEPADSNLDSGRKIIKSARILMETNNFEAVTTEIINNTNSVGGYIESSDITGRRLNNQGTIENRRAYFKLRIPEARLTGFILDINNLGNVINSQTRGDDITGQYFDTEARLKSLRIHEERLLDILKKAAKIEDVITLEKELSNIRYEIENLTGTLKKWDNLVNFATLDIEVMEVQEIQEAKKAPYSLQDRMATGFNSSVKLLTELSKGFLVVVVSLVPFAIVIVPLALAGLYIYKRKIKKDDLNQ